MLICCLSSLFNHGDGFPLTVFEMSGACRLSVLCRIFSKHLQAESAD